MSPSTSPESHPRPASQVVLFFNFAMTYFEWVDDLHLLRLDVVGIVAVLGEGCTARTIDASSLSWHHLLPRLLPAPQALLKHDRPRRLDTEEGIVVGVLSGNHSSRLNHFCRLLHNEPLQRYEVEYVHVTRPFLGPVAKTQAFRAKPFGHLALVSILGTILAIGLLIASVACRDGFAFAATILLALTSTIVGFASRWKLELAIPKPREDRANAIPDSDLVICYPTGAFRVVKCTEEISRLYFTPEVCNRDVISDNTYRLLALLASTFLMIGLLCMGNSQVQLQLAFAGSYIFLNICYWIVSAVNPMKHHWTHDYKVEKLKFAAPLKRYPLPEVRQSPSKDSRKTTAHTATYGKSNMSQVHVSQSDPADAPQQTTPNTGIVEDGGSPIPQLRRKQKTDLEALKIRVQTVFAKPARISRTLSDLRWPKHKAIEQHENRRFTEALWITIALTGSARWLRNTRIAPDTNVWHRWIMRAERRILSRRNQDGQLVSALKEHNNEFIIPPWNYDGTLLQLLRAEKEEIKNRPPDPQTLEEIFHGQATDRNGIQVRLGLSVRPKLKRWARQAKQRIEDGNFLPLPALVESSYTHTVTSQPGTQALRMNTAAPEPASNE